jgi:hypothetical protein
VCSYRVQDIAIVVVGDYGGLHNTTPQTYLHKLSKGQRLVSPGLNALEHIVGETRLTVLDHVVEEVVRRLCVGTIICGV